MSIIRRSRRSLLRYSVTLEIKDLSWMQNETTTLTQPLLTQLCTITTYDLVFVLIFELMHVKQLIKPQKNSLRSNVLKKVKFTHNWTSWFRTITLCFRCHRNCELNWKMYKRLQSNVFFNEWIHQSMTHCLFCWKLKCRKNQKYNWE